MTILKQSNRRKEIVAIAARLFKEKSFDRTTVRMLASATGLKSGSLFHHFKDKQEMLVAVIESGLKKSIETIESVAVESSKMTTIDEKLFAAIHGHLNTLHGHEKDAHIVSIADWRALSDESKEHLIGLRDQYEAHWQEIVAEAVDKKILVGDPSLVRLFILGSLNWTIQWFQPDKELTVKQLAEQFYSSVSKN